jgi:hypothetical protein
MDHPKMIEWDMRMKAMFDRIDKILEDKYQGRWKVRRNRPERGETANPESDGLFNVGSFFDPGFGKGITRGYLVEVVVASAEELAEEERERIEGEVEELLAAFLPQDFPERRLAVDREGRMLKIHGDLKLGTA